MLLSIQLLKCKLIDWLICSVLQQYASLPFSLFRFIGVTWSSRRSRWAVNLTLPTEQAGRSTCVFFGCFDTDEEAARVADKGRIRHVRLRCTCSIVPLVTYTRCRVQKELKSSSKVMVEQWLLQCIALAIISCRVKDFIGASWSVIANCEITY